MNDTYLVATGVMSAIGRYRSVDGCGHVRDAQVICRTPRGLEVGRVLTSLDPGADDNGGWDGEGRWDGELVREVTVQDRLLIERLERYRDRAFESCRRLLEEASSPITLVDVEHLFDGKSLYFYFLGEPTPAVDQMTEQLAALYGKRVMLTRFADTLANGCGPHCGTAQGAGCGETGCATCARGGGCAVGARGR
jgi:hypothetical protein